MRVRTHLVAMPWAQPESPSIQIACLKAHLDRTFAGRADCHAYSAFFSILQEFKGGSLREFFEEAEVYGEYAYLPLFLWRFGPAGFRSRSAARLLVERLRVPSVKPLSLTAVRGLERATRSFLDARVGPNLVARGLNLVGFTLNYHQVYASLYAAEHLRQRHPNRRFLFVYGGAAASLPTVRAVMTRLGVPGVIVVGEGEKKLELLVRHLQDLPEGGAGSAPGDFAGLDPGIVAIGEGIGPESDDPACRASQVRDLGELALPDYREFFSTLREACADRGAYAAFRGAAEVSVEGSRGCYCRCDFCGLNRIWHGFRKRAADEVLRSALALTLRYRTSRVIFVDSVCSTWAGELARLLVRDGVRLRMTMELRAGHPERFWTLLALAGLERVQVGVEAVSPPLLKAMGKGTRVIENLAAQKYLTELGVFPSNYLITHHPASTLGDVRETRRVVAQIPHWAPFVPNRFLLMAGSPLCRGLRAEERAKLRPTRSFRLPAGAARFAIEYAYEMPASLRLRPEVGRAWSAFAREYRRGVARRPGREQRLDVAKVAPDLLRITDTRGGRVRVHDFAGAAAATYDSCHAGLTPGGIVEATGLPPETVRGWLARFQRLRLVLRVEDSYLSLALRPRDELVRRLFAAPAA